MHGAIEDFAQELAAVVRHFLRTKGWKNTRRIVVGGGFRWSRVGELAIGRASVLVKTAGFPVDLIAIRHHPDEAGLMGAVELVPRWILAGYDSVLAVDIGGSNIRAGLVAIRFSKADGQAESSVMESDLWRHANEQPDREGTVARLVSMLEALIVSAEKQKMKLAPFIGIGCPGIIGPDGSIIRGGQNLPSGNWEKKNFNLPERLREAIPKIGDHEISIIMHNDAVVQGLSEVPFMQDVAHWGILTIGTGLGNARFSNRNEIAEAEKQSARKKG